MQRLQNRPFALRSHVRGEMNRLCGAGRVRAVGDRLKRSVPTAASRQTDERCGVPRDCSQRMTTRSGPAQGGGLSQCARSSGFAPTRGVSRRVRRSGQRARLNRSAREGRGGARTGSAGGRSDTPLLRPRGISARPSPRSGRESRRRGTSSCARWRTSRPPGWPVRARRTPRARCPVRRGRPPARARSSP